MSICTKSSHKMC